jgi:polysaccharide export outer membrane protein
MVATLTLQGCVIAPGMKAQSTGQVEVEQGTVVRVQPITMELLNRLAAEREAEIRNLANELAEPRAPYRIGPGDVLQIVVWDHPELTNPVGEFRDAESSGQQVGEDGLLYYPYVGTIEAAGKTTAELRRIITSALSEYIQNPQLDVRVAAYRS